MQDKDTTPSTFFQLFGPVLDQDLWSQVYSKVLGVDGYVKKLKTHQLIELLVNAELAQAPGLRVISNSLNEEAFSNYMGLNSISSSQLSRRLRDLPVEVSNILFTGVIHKFGRELGFETVRRGIGRLNLIDSSTITLCLSQYKWATFRKTKAGVKLHLGLNFTEFAVPAGAMITTANKADKTQMDSLIVTDPDVMNVFDRGYIDYGKFDEYCEKGIRFVCRLKENAVVEITQEHFVEEDSPIDDDLMVLLGQGRTRMKHELRVITTKDSQGNPITIVTDDVALSAQEIGDIYCNRWQVELFFKWLKQHAQIKHFYGKSFAAVTNQILIALLTYCVLTLLQLKCGHKGPILVIQRLVMTCRFESFSSFVRKLYGKCKSSRGRRKLKDDEIYLYTEEQILAGDTEIYYETTHDPLIP